MRKRKLIEKRSKLSMFLDILMSWITAKQLIRRLVMTKEQSKKHITDTISEINRIEKLGNKAKEWEWRDLLNMKATVNNLAGIKIY